MTLLFSPFKIGSIKLKNRLVMPPCETNLAKEDGSATDHTVAYYAERAKGGVGFIIVEATYISQSGRGRRYQLGLDRDELIPSYKKLVDAVQAYDTKIAIELQHGGRQNRYWQEWHQYLPEAPSPVICTCLEQCDVPIELTKEKMKQIAEDYAEAARRAKEAGFDSVEIHGAHGYLLTEFLSLYTNKRTDEYGGSLENRMRFPLEVVAKVKEKVGSNYPLIYRMSADEYVEGGLTLDDTRPFAKKLEETGIHAIDVSAAIYETFHHMIPYMATPRGNLLHLAKGIKEVVNIPVIANSGLDHTNAEKVLEDGMADLVGSGRGLMCDPHWPKKLAEGRPEDIIRCIRCNVGLERMSVKQIEWCCTVNALAGREGQYSLEKARDIKNILVIGGGPAGMETARVAAIRGHNVTLCEAGDVLGGQLQLAGKASHKLDFMDILNYYCHQMDKLNINCVMNQEVDMAYIENLKPNVIVVATGATPITPEIPGINRPNVTTAFEVLSGNRQVGKKVLIAGGGMIGCETALVLRENEKDVTVIEMLDRIPTNPTTFMEDNYIQEKFQEVGIKVITNAKLKRVLESGVIYEKTRPNLVTNTGIEKEIKDVDSVVLAIGLKSERSLVKQVLDKGYQVYEIGDCVSPRKLLEAIHEGFQIGVEI